ncbi:MAG: hypothetical protein GWP36_00165 [Bacteroidetes bacterium]|nr:hypothetical protein [Bacteroidota bacterium]
MANSLPPKSPPPKVSAGKASGGKASSAKASVKASAKAAIDHVSGHRARMREKLLAKGADSLSELELLEMLLYAGNTRSDTKPLAKNLIREFGSLSAVLRASSETLGKQTKMGAASIAALKIVEAAGLHLSHSNIHKRQVLTSWAAVQHYCINRLAHEPIEHFNAVYG